ncbi:hypothetical protein B0J11DRAFT_516920 [Dendryphion nanum]|uniref:Zinc finger Mcm10/DnaG-type domain-containing protein n=1 Tax=Dendryphion nanum TaxID=256645 RepID=A0A9P9EL76_9PLEO|nr:hypothetical protein B0J11DRAFT_516920 [Dendryphion nanum]
MIVRESPKARVKNNQPNWPPKSPHEALLSSPSGRRKYQQRRQRESVSPSPMKRRPAGRSDDQEEHEEDDEDEEELELKLEAIQTKLRLKKLQKARQAAGEGDSDSTNISSRPSTAAGVRRVELPRPDSTIQVPVSPTRQYRAPQEQTSPARIVLGIDKGLRAQDVSLKRAPSFNPRNGLSRSNSTRDAEPPRKSFSERLAESRAKEKEKEDKQVRIEKSRSTGFGLKNLQVDDGSSRASSSLSSGARNTQEHPPKREGISQSRSINDLRSKAGSSSRPPSTLSTRAEAREQPRPFSAASRGSSSTPLPESRSKTATKYAEIAERDNSSSSASFESFSSLHLRTRTMQHNEVARALDEKSILTIPQLLKTVKAPDYDPPDMENDYVVMGVIASKSDPLTPKNVRRENSTGNQDTNVHQSNKFMVIRLTDLKWELDLFLFDTGFSQFWKLPVGTVVAILNPEIMRPRQSDTGKFSLKLGSSDDTILEIGTARDLDFCHAKRKDGKDCGQWIDGRKTEFCDFHIELQVEKSKRGRMEVNTMTGFGKGNGGGRFGGGGRGSGLKSEDLRREGRFHDRTIHETVYIAPSAGAAARLMDEQDTGFERGADRAERYRKQLAGKEKERELAKRLGAAGRGAGSDYMKVKTSDTPILPTQGDAFLSQSAAIKQDSPSIGNLDSMSLLNRKANDVSLAPVKRKRIISGKSTASSEPMGWGGAYKRGLLLSPIKDSSAPARIVRETSPAKKRARLLLPEKGIREPGRDSLGTLDVGLLAAMDDDDDDLDIVG